MIFGTVLSLTRQFSKCKISIYTFFVELMTSGVHGPSFKDAGWLIPLIDHVVLDGGACTWNRSRGSRNA